MSEDQTVDLGEYFSILRRRRWTFFIITAFLLALILPGILLWPPTYRSTATILIKEQDISTDLVRSAVTSSAVQRIETITQQVMTRANLLRIIEKFDLFVEARKEQRFEKALNSMRKRIKVDTVDIEVTDPRSGRPGQIAIAFTVSFEFMDPEVTQKVTEELTKLFVEQNLKTREAKASETFDFLTTEANLLSAQIAHRTTANRCPW